MSCVKRALEHPVASVKDEEQASAKRSRRVLEEVTHEEEFPLQPFCMDMDLLKNLQRHNAKYDKSLKYVQFRSYLVGFVIDVCQDFKLMGITMHRSLNYLDRLLSKHTHISRKCYPLVATACILVAAKFEEQPHKVPAMNDLLKEHIVGAGHDTKAQLLAAEKLLLETLEWNAHSATHLHFSQCYQNKGVLFSSDRVDGQPAAPKDIRVIVRYVDHIATMCLEEYCFLQYDQSLIAAAGLAAARRCCRVDPVWPDDLLATTGYSSEHIGECYEAILKLFRDNYKDCHDGLDANASPRSSTSYFFGEVPHVSSGDE